MIDRSSAITSWASGITDHHWNIPHHKLNMKSRRQEKVTMLERRAEWARRGHPGHRSRRGQRNLRCLRKLSAHRGEAVSHTAVRRGCTAEKCQERSSLVRAVRMTEEEAAN